MLLVVVPICWRTERLAEQTVEASEARAQGAVEVAPTNGTVSERALGVAIQRVLPRVRR